VGGTVRGKEIPGYNCQRLLSWWFSTLDNKVFLDRERCEGVSSRDMSSRQRLEVALYWKERYTPEKVQRHTLGVRLLFQGRGRGKSAKPASQPNGVKGVKEFAVAGCGQEPHQKSKYIQSARIELVA